MAYEAARTSEVAYMDEVRRLFGGYKQGTFDRLRLQPGHRVLDVGCGPGSDARAMAARVEPGGEVVGVDRDEEMIEQARSRPAAGTPVRFVLADAYALPFEDASFDGCRSDRVFQHLDEPERALAECFRVLKPGGRCVVADADWGTLTVATSLPALTRTVLDLGSDLHRNGWAARGLYGQFRSVGFADVDCEMSVAHTTEWAVAAWAFGLEHYAAQAAERELISESERDAWLADLRERDRAGTFFSSIMGGMAWGHRP